MKLYVFKKWSSCTDNEKMIKLKQGAIWTDINVCLISVTMLIIAIFII